VLQAVIVNAHLSQFHRVRHAKVITSVARTQFIIRARDWVAENLQLISEEEREVGENGSDPLNEFCFGRRLPEARVPVPRFGSFASPRAQRMAAIVRKATVGHVRHVPAKDIRHTEGGWRSNTGRLHHPSRPCNRRRGGI
jgi:hypothetical protein